MQSRTKIIWEKFRRKSELMTFNILFVNSFGNFTLSVITNCRKYLDFGILIEDEADIYEWTSIFVG